jgi:pilus assembly protein CpaE
VLGPELAAQVDSLDATETRAGVLREVQDRNPSVLVVGPGRERADALALARAVDECRPDVSVILVSESSPDLLQDAVRVGVRDLVSPDSPDASLRGSLELALETATRRRAALRNALETETASKVITVVSPKGGAGKTALATNLAVGLARVAPNEVVIVDLDLQFGDVGHALRLTPERTIADMARAGSNLDATTVKAFLTPHPSGCFVLCAPDSPADADDVKPQLLGSAIDLLAEMFRYVVIDTGAGLDEATLTAVEHATDLVLISATDVASARGLRKGVEVLDLLGFTNQRRHFALNRADARVGITIQDVESTVGLDVAFTIPSARAVPTSMNQGSPVLESDPRGNVGKGFLQVVRRVAPTFDTPRPQTATSGSRRRRTKEFR